MAKYNRNNMPKPKEILSFWADKILNEYPNKFYLDIHYEQGITENEKTACCFACGNNVGTERAHILPINQGGDNSLENLHLLCKECHIESENFFGNIYWKWFGLKNSFNSGSQIRLMNKVNAIIKMVENGQKKEVAIGDYVECITQVIEGNYVGSLTVGKLYQVNDIYRNGIGSVIYKIMSHNGNYLYLDSRHFICKTYN